METTTQEIDIPCREPVPPVLSLLEKQILCIAGLGRGCGKSFVASSLQHLLGEAGLQADLFHSRIGSLHHGCFTRSPITIVEIEPPSTLWYELAHEVILIVDPTVSNGLLIPEASQFFSELERLDHRLTVRLLVNRATNVNEARWIFARMKKEIPLSLSFPLTFFGYLPPDPHLESWTPERDLFVKERPDRVLSRCLKVIVDQIRHNYTLWRC